MARIAEACHLFSFSGWSKFALLTTWIIWGPCSFILCFVNKGSCKNLWTGRQIWGGVSSSLWLPWLMIPYLLSASGGVGDFPTQQSWDRRLYRTGSIHRWERRPVHSSAGLQPGVLPSSLRFPCLEPSAHAPLLPSSPPTSTHTPKCNSSLGLWLIHSSRILPRNLSGPQALCKW